MVLLISTMLLTEAYVASSQGCGLWPTRIVCKQESGRSLTWLDLTPKTVVVALVRQLGVVAVGDTQGVGKVKPAAPA